MPPPTAAQRSKDSISAFLNDLRASPRTAKAIELPIAAYPPAVAPTSRTSTCPIGAIRQRVQRGVMRNGQASVPPGTRFLRLRGGSTAGLWAPSGRLVATAIVGAAVNPV